MRKSIRWVSYKLQVVEIRNEGMLANRFDVAVYESHR